MSEKEKMLAGDLYWAGADELKEMRHQARELIRQYNQSAQDDEMGRQSILAQLFGAVGDNAVIEVPFHCTYGQHISVGAHFRAGADCLMVDACPIVIGHDVVLGPRVILTTDACPVDAAVRRRDLAIGDEIRIGSNVWIGANVVINPGVTIGAGAVIQPGSVVVNNIAERVIAGGNPCKAIRKIDASDEELWTERACEWEMGG
ncbi:MAG: sugar O-acetyltransferase [Ndongobacter sp.]|nr:sugar O-acetyltransferase [Ndongobacter sp.]